MEALRIWLRFCQNLYIAPNIGFSLDISRMEFSESFFFDIQPKFKKAFDEMSALEAGEIANLDENRMVGHYWARNPELAPTADIRAAISREIEKIKSFAAKIHSGDISPEKHTHFSHVLIIGIGGSALGPQLIADALWQPEHTIQLHFCDNTDPDGIKRIKAEIGDELAQTLCLVVSKSGGTAETRNGMIEFQNAFKEQDLSFAKHTVAITVEDSKLDSMAKDNGWIAQFYIWDWIGGRTSVFSAVGLLPAALQGIDIDELLLGAKEMDILTRNRNVEQNPAALLAAMWLHTGNGKGLKDLVILPYKDRLILFSRYLQQLIMESLGKELDRNGKQVCQGIAVYGNKGSTDQHAYVQQLRDGIDNFFVTFIEVLGDYYGAEQCCAPLEVEPGITTGDYLSGFYLGTRTALSEKGRESITLTIDNLTPSALGALIALFDRAVGLYASLININPYHQPGVEAGKKAAQRVIELQGEVLDYLGSLGGTSVTVTDIATSIEADNEIETIYKILERFACNPRRGVSRSGNRHPDKVMYRYTPLQ